MRVFRRQSSGFTLVELMVVIAIIAVLVSLVTVALTSTLNFAKVSGEQQAAASIKLGVEQFRQEFGFLPPLVLHDDDKTIASAPVRPVQRVSGSFFINSYGGTVSSEFYNPNPLAASSNMFLEGFVSGGAKGMTSDSRLGSASANIAARYVADRRFSEYSLAYYLAGALSASLDGVDGPGMNAPKSDGNFSTVSDSKSTRVSKSARIYQPFVDVSRDKPKLDLQLATPNSGEPQFPIRYRLLAPNGLPYRYYRWESRKNGPPPGTFRKWDFYVAKDFADEDDVDRLNVPSILGNPRENAELRSASYAIVSAGPNQYFGDMPLEAATYTQFCDMQAALGVPQGAQYNARTRDTARKDNIVEVGR